MGYRLFLYRRRQFNSPFTGNRHYCFVVWAGQETYGNLEVEIKIITKKTTRVE
jgi:hypothetical protein